MEFRLVRMLIIVKELAYSKRGKMLLTTERAMIYDFLLRYPYVLQKIEESLDIKKVVTLTEIEFGTIEVNYINKQNIFDYKFISNILLMLINIKHINVHLTEKDLYYTITEKGSLVLGQLKTNHYYRLYELTGHLMDLNKFKTNKLIKEIKTNLK